MIHFCEGCRRAVAKEDRRRKTGPSFVVLSGAKLDLSSRLAPAVICPCGRRIVFVKGRV